MKVSLVNRKTDEEFISLFRASHSQTEFAYSLGIFNCGGGTYFALKERCEKLGLDRKKQWNGALKKTGIQRYQNDRDYFSENTSHTGADMRDRIVKEGLMPYRCALCGNSGRWKGKELILQVDHINGDHFDNRLENIRFLCPNCHTQTKTYSGKNVSKRPMRSGLPKNVSFDFSTAPGAEKIQKAFFCRYCGKAITRWSKNQLCPECSALRSRKVPRPLSKDLFAKVFRERVSGAARYYGVCDNTIKKWLRCYHLPSLRKAILSEGEKRHLKR
jgi:Zn finger protein HypA/HybF involved in hydrogenase expression